MKKAALIAVLFFGFSASAQRTFRIINNSSSDITIGNIGTTNSTNTVKLTSYPDVGYTIPSLSTFIMSNGSDPSKFPYLYLMLAGGIDIAQWVVSGVGIVSKSVAYSTYAVDQAFEYIKMVWGTGASLGGGTFGPNYSGTGPVGAPTWQLTIVTNPTTLATTVTLADYP